MRGFAALLAYVVGLSAVVSIGIIGVMALPKRNAVRTARSRCIAERTSRQAGQASDNSCPKRCAT